MKKSLIVFAALICLSSAAFAADCDTQLTLACTANYLAQNGALVQTASVSDHLADEHWDEPSEANCAATVYITQDLPGTSVRVYAEKDLTSSQVSLDSEASQIEDHMVNGTNYRDAFYSNELTGSTKVSDAINLGVLHLAKPIARGSSPITDISVTCVIR